MQNDDSISRQMAIDAVCNDAGCGKFCGIPCTTVGVLLRLPSAQPDNQTHLCNSCKYCYPDCPSKNDDVIFGNGVGNDNICACKWYDVQSKQKLISPCAGCQEFDCNGCKFRRH